VTARRRRFAAAAGVWSGRWRHLGVGSGAVRRGCECERVVMPAGKAKQIRGTNRVDFSHSVQF
jgi:hypothetical protein